MAPEEWRRVVDVNLTGSFNTIRALTPGMVAARRGLDRQYLVHRRQDLFAGGGLPLRGDEIGDHRFYQAPGRRAWPLCDPRQRAGTGRINTPMVAGVAPEVNAEQVKLTPWPALASRPRWRMWRWLTSTRSSFVTGQTIDVAGGLYDLRTRHDHRSTKVFGIVANPIAHVKTPEEMNNHFAALGYDGVLVPCTSRPKTSRASLTGYAWSKAAAG